MCTGVYVALDLLSISHKFMIHVKNLNIDLFGSVMPASSWYPVVIGDH